MAYFPGFTSIDQKDLKARQKFQNSLREEFCSCRCSMALTKNENTGECISNSKQVSDYAKEFQQGHWPFFGPGKEEKEDGTSKPIR